MFFCGLLLTLETFRAINCSCRNCAFFSVFTQYLRSGKNIVNSPRAQLTGKTILASGPRLFRPAPSELAECVRSNGKVIFQPSSSVRCTQKGSLPNELKAACPIGLFSFFQKQNLWMTSHRIKDSYSSNH